MSELESAVEEVRRAVRLLTFGWFVSGIELFRELARRRRAREKLRHERQQGVPCQVIPATMYKRPDPLLYSQQYLMAQGLAVTWDNPDIGLFLNGAPVSSSDLVADTEYEVRARIWNGSTEAAAIGLGVDFSFLSFGIATASTPIGTTSVDLPVRGAPGHPAMASMPWRTPALPGHYCLQVDLKWADDANPLNNLGQENTNVGVAHSPAVFEFPVANQTQVSQHISLETDTYTLADPIDCREVVSGRLVPRDERGRPLTGDALCKALADRHRQGQFPVPPGWQVDVQPPEFDVGPGLSQNVKVTVEPPSGFTGTQALNVNAFNRDHAFLGGVTLYTQR